MSFSVPQKVLSEMLSIAIKGMGGKSTIPVMECVRIIPPKQGATGISIESTNMDLWLKVSEEGHAPDQANAIIAPARQIAAIVNGLSASENVEFVATEKKLTVKAEKSKYNFGLLPPEDWPQVMPEKMSPFEIKSVDLRQGFDFAGSSMGAEEVRVYLNGLHLLAAEDKHMRAAASDGHQMSRMFVPLDVDSVLPEKGVIIDRRTINIVNDIIGMSEEDRTVIFSANPNRCQFKFVSKYQIELVSKLIESEYPKIDAYIPYDRNSVVTTVPREEVLRALRRIEIISRTEKFSPLLIDIGAGFMKLFCNSKTNGDQAEELISVSSNSQDMVKISLGQMKMFSVLSSFDGDEIDILTDPERPGQSAVVFVDRGATIDKTKGRLAIIMPMARGL